MEISYVSSTGEKLVLTEKPYFIEKSQLYDFKWSLALASRPMGDGGRIVSRRRESYEKTIDMYIYAENARELAKAVNKLADVTGGDVEKLTPGRLYAGEQYLPCYISAGEKEVDGDWELCVRCRLTVMPENPCWHSERRFIFSAQAQADENGHKYPSKYPRRYTFFSSSETVMNDHCAESPAVIKIYGPAENPRFTLAGREMGLNVTLLDGEYAVIDQINRTVTKTDAQGDKTGIFDKRLKNGAAFLPLPAGACTVECSQSLNMEITVVKQRSEPEWS